MNHVALFLLVTLSCLITPGMQVLYGASNDWTIVEIGIIGTSSDDVLESAIQQVNDQNHGGLIIQLDTPGGSLNATREMVKKIMAAPFPVIVWVGPDGSRAGSAGAFITLAGNVAAMAPGTNIGAAHPIQASGQDIENKESARKIEEDTVAFIESIAARRGRNVDMARSFVTVSASITAEEALKNNVIDFLAHDRSSLLSELDGRQVTLNDTTTMQLKTKSARLVPYEYSLKQDFLAILSNPQVFYLLFVAGLIGLGFELTHPGAIVPGVAGGICLILALIATSVLPISFGAMLLAIVGVVFLVAEAFLPSFGVLGIGGFISFMIGSFLLVDPGNEQGLRLPISTILPVGLFVGAAGLALGYLLFKSESSKVVSGPESMIGATAEVIAQFQNGAGSVKYEGERWEAAQLNPDDEFNIGDKVRISKVDGLKLIVEKLTI